MYKHICLDIFVWLSNLLVLNIPDEGYSIKASCALNLISTFFSLICCKSF